MRFSLRWATSICMLLVALLLLTIPAQLFHAYPASPGSRSAMAGSRNSSTSRTDHAQPDDDQDVPALAVSTHKGGKSSGQAAPNINAQMDALFVPVDARSSVNDATLHAQGIDAVTYGMEPVMPAEYNGDVRQLTPVPINLARRSIDFEERLRYPETPIGMPDSSDFVKPQAPVIAAPMPTPIQSFFGLSRLDAVTGGQAGAGFPPDTNGDVGPTHYIQSVNDAYAIYDKATGTQVAAFTENSLFSAGPTGTLCDTDSFGDPVVVYDQFSDRWILTNFAFVANGTTGLWDPPIYQCFAASKTSNPVTGGWWLYAVRIDTGAVPNNTLHDYPKFGNWNDSCLYMGANGFSGTTGIFSGNIFATFRKSDMYNGLALTSSIGFQNLGSSLFPSNISGAKGAAFVPPAGTPNYFVRNSSTTAFQVRKFTPGANCGAGGTMAAATTVSHTSGPTPGTDNVPQPNDAGSAHSLDNLGSRIMQKVQYRRVGAAESLWVIHTVQPTGNPTASQWAQINVTGGTVVTTPVQQQIFAPDTTLWRWMGSVAVDHAGNMAIGYSTSNATAPNFPSIAYAGRLVGDTSNQLPQTETQLVAGLGSQLFDCGGAACHRWGDYSSMSIDPSDDCTFWYTTQYFDTQANGDPAQRNWRTRIGSFKFPSCSAPTAAQSSINGRVTDSDGNGVGGVVVELSGASAATTITDSNGNYSFDNVETASFYTITPQLANYSFSPVNRSFSLAGNLTDATFTATLASNAANPLDTNMYFVRQQYLDFLGREPDSGGLQYWTSRFNECGGDAACITRKRIDVSAAFFMSQEFQETGSYVYRLYKAGLGRNLSYAEFSTDRSQVLAGDNLDARRAALAAAFVARPEFAQRYANATSAEAFADALLLTMKQSSGVDLSAQRDALVAKFNSGGSVVESRSLALQAIAEAEQFKQAEYNRSFVQMQYFGYLKRNPDQGGFDFWVDVLNNRVPGNFRAMVCAFITSGEYQNRFSAVITHSNSDCYGAL